jgi:hypothetical protein
VGVDNFALNRPLLITLLQISPLNLPRAPNQHYVAQIINRLSVSARFSF